MTADSLLVWMSARGSGSWQQFRAAVEDLHLADCDRSPEDMDDTAAVGLPLYQLLRLNVQRVGHAEFFGGAGDAEWRIVPPTLAIAGREPSTLGILVGARSPSLMRRLEAASGDSLESFAADSYPTQFRIRSTVTDLMGIAARADIVVQPDAPLLMLLSLPAIDDLFAYRRSELPFGSAWTVERFSISTLTWKPAARAEAVTGSGLFRFSFRHERRVFYCVRGAATELGAQAGKYLLLKRRRRRVFEYDRTTQTVAVRPTYRPPFLIERALILCSGLPPTFDASAGCLVYRGVPDQIGRLAAQLLRQDF
jgi:hypothetical protein